MKEIKTILRNPGNALFCLELGDSKTFIKLVEKYLGLNSFVSLWNNPIINIQVKFKKNQMIIERIK